MRLVVDSSANVALLRREPGYESIAERMASAEELLISAATWLETSIVVERIGDPILTRDWDHLGRTQEISIEPVTEEQVRIAREAYRDFGKGSGHRAQLNFGDCFAYALAKERLLPLLAVGDDFRHTDLDVIP